MNHRSIATKDAVEEEEKTYSNHQHRAVCTGGAQGRPPGFPGKVIGGRATKTPPTRDGNYIKAQVARDVYVHHLLASDGGERREGVGVNHGEGEG